MIVERRLQLFRTLAHSLALLGSTALAPSASGQGCPGTVQSWQKVNELNGGFGGGLTNYEHFGSGLTCIGDLDGDGVKDLAVGANQYLNHVRSDKGAIWILFMNPNGTVRARQEITEGVGGFGGLLSADGQFGCDIAALGDLDGDGITELAVGALGSVEIWILFLNADGTVKAEQQIDVYGAGGFGGGFSGWFGWSVAAPGDLDADGVQDLAVGAPLDGDGSLWILFLNADGTVRDEQEVTEGVGSFAGDLGAFDYFGSSIARLGDLDGDGIEDLAVGAYSSDGRVVNQGSLWILFLEADGTVKAEQKIAESSGGFGQVIAQNSFFGTSAVSVGDLDGDGTVDLAVGAAFRSTVWLLFMNADGTVKDELKIAEGIGGFGGSVSGDYFGEALGALGDLDGDGVADLAVGAPNDGDSGAEIGSFWILFLEGEDVTGPMLTHPAAVRVIDAKSGPPGTNVSFTVTATDGCDPAPSLVCVPPSGSFFPRGTTLVTCTATDASGNTSVGTFPVIVNPTVRVR